MTVSRGLYKTLPSFLIDTFPEDYRLSALTWVMGQLLGVIAGNLGYTPTTKFNGHKWIIKFEKDD